MLGVLAALLSFQNGPPPPYDWRSVPADSYDYVVTGADGAKWSMQHRAVLRALMDRPQIHTLWVRIDYSKVAREPASYSLEKLTFYCATGTVTEGLQVWYSASGKVLRTDPAPQTGEVVPGTVMESVRDAACK